MTGQHIGELIDYPRDRPCTRQLMSNSSHEVDQEIAQELRKGQTTATYPGWYFHATCWWDDTRKKYMAAVRQHHKHVATFEADTPEELMQLVSAEYGDE